MSGAGVPPDLQTRMSGIFNRMTARGLTQRVQVCARVTVKDASGKPAARQKSVIATLTGYKPDTSGSEQTGQEGAQRESERLTLYLAQDGSGTITSANYSQRWIILPDTDSREWIIESVSLNGPYIMLTLSTGGTNDAAGGIR